MLRSNRDDATEAMRRAFGAYVIDDDSSPEANYSVFVSDDPDSFHRLYRGACIVVASPDVGRVLTALVRHVGAHGPTPEGLVAVQALGLVHDGAARLAPTLLEEDLRDFTRRLAQRGVTLVDSHTVYLDLERRELVVGNLLDELDLSALEVVRGLTPERRRADPPVADGRYSLERWLMMELWEPVGPYGRATASRRAALVLRDGVDGSGPEVLRRLAGLFEQVPAEGIDPESRVEILAHAVDGW